MRRECKTSESQHTHTHTHTRIYEITVNRCVYMMVYCVAVFFVYLCFTVCFPQGSRDYFGTTIL